MLIKKQYEKWGKKRSLCVQTGLTCHVDMLNVHLCWWMKFTLGFEEPCGVNWYDMKSSNHKYCTLFSCNMTCMRVQGKRFKALPGAVLMFTIQPRVVVQQNLDYMQAGQESLELQVEHWASAGGMLAARAWTQPGCKASVAEGRQDWLLPDKMAVVQLWMAVHGRAVWGWAELGSQAGVDGGAFPGRIQGAQELPLDAEECCWPLWPG